MSDITPTVGRHVDLYSEHCNGGILAAVITEVEDAAKGIVSLHVMTKTGCHPKQGVSRGTGEGQWDWMPYQKGQAAKEAASAGLSAASEAASAPETVAPAGEVVPPAAGEVAAPDAPPAGEAMLTGDTPPPAAGEVSAQ